MRRRHGNKNYMFVFGVFAGLICVMTVGYAAFSTNLNIKVKGNLVDSKKISPSELKNNIVTSGDGLYLDSTEENRYIYRGANPDNYITFNNQLWRIISLESDGTLKVISNNALGLRQFDSASGRYKSGTYCNLSGYGCNVWGSKSTMLDSNASNITTMAYQVQGSSYLLPSEESDLNIYLNTTYYNEISLESKAHIYENHLWNVGVVYHNNKYLKTTVTEEKANKWKGNVGLISPSDYLKASTDTSCTSIANGYYENSSTPCKNNNYLQTTFTYWTLSPWYSDAPTSLCAVSGDGNLTTLNAYHTKQVRPVTYLKSEITLSGKGTQEEPYTINQ